MKIIKPRQLRIKFIACESIHTIKKLYCAAESKTKKLGKDTPNFCLKAAFDAQIKKYCKLKDIGTLTKRTEKDVSKKNKIIYVFQHKI